MAFDTIVCIPRRKLSVPAYITVKTSSTANGGVIPLLLHSSGGIPGEGILLAPSAYGRHYDSERDSDAAEARSVTLPSLFIHLSQHFFQNRTRCRPCSTDERTIPTIFLRVFKTSGSTPRNFYFRHLTSPFDRKCPPLVQKRHLTLSWGNSRFVRPRKRILLKAS